jgi:N-formylglutamate deformylase
VVGAVKASRANPSFIQSFGPSGKPLLVTLPHSGEKIPPEAGWLSRLPERLLMYDVDRYVDELYEPTLSALGIAWVKTHWHRYACDLNRLASDIDAQSVIGSENPRGAFPRGLHWSMTTQGEPLMPGPISFDVHQAIVDRCLTPFHLAVENVAEAVRPRGLRSPKTPVYHLDLHSMPSFGTKEHRDPGEWRADLVISNQDGKSSSADFFEMICAAGRSHGFSVKENWPYKGGRITETYGRPAEGWETVQIELNRKLYMDERSKKKEPSRFLETRLRVGRLLTHIHAQLKVSGEV